MEPNLIYRIAPWRQTNWDWRAAGNFIGGGTGTGLLILAAGQSGGAYQAAALAGLLFIAAGLLCVWAEIGRPLRAFNVFRHVTTSWMTREAMVAPVLFLSGFAALLGGGGALAWLTALLALLFLFCQARMLRAARGIPAWRDPRIVPLILSTGLAEGAGVLLVVQSIGSSVTRPAWLPASLVLLLLVRIVAWQAYQTGLARTGAPQGTLRVLRRLSGPFLIAGTIAIALVLIGSAIGVGAWLAALAGLVSVISGWVLKFTIVTRAAFNQGFALPKSPERGTGGTGPAAKPGWSGTQ